MIFNETKLKGAFIIEPQTLKDERGFFARTFCQGEFKAHGLNLRVAQCNISFNAKKGALRGMHFQVTPHQEAKLVSCVRGVIYDVIIDLRSDSPTYCQWFAVKLSSDNYKMFYIPEGVAHGFQALEDNTVAFYQISQSFNPQYSRGVRWDDPAFGIKWPLLNPILSVKDGSFRDFA